MITGITLTMIFLLFAVAVLYDAIGDGIRQRKEQTTQLGIKYHLSWGTALLALLVVGYFYPDLKQLNNIESTITILLTIWIYTATRFVIFDTARNIAKGDHWLYIGNTAWQDRIFNKIFNKNNFLKGVFLGIKWVIFWGTVALVKYWFL